MTAIIAANPIGAIAVGLTTAATLIITNWSKVQVFFQHIWQPIKEAWSKFADWIGGFWSKISSPFKAIKNAWSGLWGDNRLEGGKEPVTPHNKAIRETLKKPLTAEKKVTNSSTHHNNVTIHVKAQPHQDTKAIADEVMQRFQSQKEDALYDVVA